MQVEHRPEGIYLPQLELWLDPKVPVENAWLSHAHSDHARGLHGQVIGSPQTLAIYRQRWPLPEGAEQVWQPLSPGESLEWRGAVLTCFTAAHILGACLLRIVHGGETLVYTGDIKASAPICGWQTEMPACDHLIIESTFGLPIFHFLGEAEARRRIAEFAKTTLGEGKVPVFLGYGLGRGQEIAYSLSQAGVGYQLHGAIAALLPHYEAAGYGFPGWQPYSRERKELLALVVTPGMQNSLPLPESKMRVALVSGWAAMDNARARASADVLIPYSDHASYAELLELVQASQAKRVDVVHGYTEAFVRTLQSRGIPGPEVQAFAQQTLVRQEVEV